MHVHSVRLTNECWALLCEEAGRQEVTPQEFVREAIVALIARNMARRGDYIAEAMTAVVDRFVEEVQVQ